ncbi:hypothetical protein [Bradyrhizobium sp. AZCC 2230]|uniref:hypothetical protein n=1 Tax=Bradyrhizobium sp. AZCC 2230 TaxID=3117021 RepID=UPI002FF02F0D
MNFTNSTDPTVGYTIVNLLDYASLMQFNPKLSHGVGVMDSELRDRHQDDADSHDGADPGREP